MEFMRKKRLELNKTRGSAKNCLSYKDEIAILKELAQKEDQIDDLVKKNMGNVKLIGDQPDRP